MFSGRVCCVPSCLLQLWDWVTKIFNINDDWRETFEAVIVLP